MPLDATGFAPRTFSTAIERLGIVPISRQVLDAHKAAEIAKHPGHWFAPYAQYYQGIMMSGTIATAFLTVANLVVVAFGCIDHHWGMAVGCGLLAIMFGAAFRYLDRMGLRSFRIKGAAKWLESSPRMFTVVPQPILDLAMAIRNELSTTTFTFILGVLVQDNIILDPYLIIRDGAEEAILGIWDDSGIIEMATVT